MSAAVLLEAIALRKCVEAEYNKDRVTLAPHILYTRHGEPYVDAITINRNGQPPREIKLGAYKLTGLRDLTITDRAFEPFGLFRESDAKYADVTLFSVAAEKAAGTD
jgi:hypothetical protein